MPISLSVSLGRPPGAGPAAEDATEPAGPAADTLTRASSPVWRGR